MIIREAVITDIRQLQLVRNSVKENMLSTPSKISDNDYVPYLTMRGKGWVCEINNQIAGFAIADVADNNIWALFISPEFEKQGIGRKLHDIMIDWYFKQTDIAVWLSTSPNTRAEKFYLKAGWTATGFYGKGEIKFEMSFEKWKSLQHLRQINF